MEVSHIFCNLAKRNKIISLWHTIRDGKRISAAVAVIKPTTGLTAKRTRQMYRGSLLRSYCCWVECSSCRCGILLGMLAMLFVLIGEMVCCWGDILKEFTRDMAACCKWVNERWTRHKEIIPTD